MKKIGLFAIATALIACGCGTIVGKSFDDCKSAAVAAQYELMARYVADKKFGQPLPRLEGAALEKHMANSLSEAEKEAIRTSVKAEFERCKKSVVFPKWVEFKNENIRSAVLDLVKKARDAASTNGWEASRAKFEAAREIVWCESVNAAIGGLAIPEVNEPVRRASIELLDTNVNIEEWKILERHMKSIAEDAIAAGVPSNGIVALVAYKDVRPYTKVLDGKVDALVGELKRLGLPGQLLERIKLNTVNFMRSAANLTDFDDKTRMQTSEARAVASLDESIYKRLLEEYRAALRLYDCTDDNTKKIIDWLAKQIAGMIAELPKQEVQKPTTEMVTERLGVSALNKRISALRDTLLSDLDKVVKHNGKISESIGGKVAGGNMTEARQLVMQILAKGSSYDNSAKALAMHELLTRINPALWEKIKREITEKTEAFAKAGKCSEGVVWLEAYPFVRTYAEEIDAQFAAVREAIQGCGVSGARAQMVMSEVAKLAAEAEHLACYVDEVKYAVRPGKKIPADKRQKYDAQVKACRDVLVRNGCTEGNAIKLVTEISNKFAPDIARIEEDIKIPVLYLGSNALNARIARLKERCVHILVGRCTSDLVSAGKFQAARNMLRDVAITGNDAFDAKVYADRLGALDTLVNPVQLEALKGEASKKIKEFWKSEDFKSLKKWIDDYKYVHDEYPEIVKALDSVRKAMITLTIKEPEATKYVELLNTRITALIESAQGEFADISGKPDLSELERALAILEKAIVAQYFDRNAVSAMRLGVRKEILAILEKQKALTSISTADMNKMLRAHFEAEVRAHAAEDAARRPAVFALADNPIEVEEVKQVLLRSAQKGVAAVASGKSKDEVLMEMAGVVAEPAINSTLEWLARLWDRMNAPKVLPTEKDATEMPFDDLMAMLVKRQEYLEFLADMDREIAYDSQIAMAEDAIAKQLDKKYGLENLCMNATLGEYARAMRLLKKRDTLTKDIGAAMVLGAIYLDQSAVLTKALELGADVNGRTPRDPLSRTGLLLAIQLGRTSLLHKLVKSGANVGVSDANRDSAIHYAVRRGNLAVLAAMIEKNDVNVRNALGETPLFDAARSNNKALVDALIAAKADVSANSLARLTPFDAACLAGSRDVLDALADAGAAYGPKQLAEAARNDHLAVAQWLVAKGVDVNADGVLEAAAKGVNLSTASALNEVISKDTRKVLSFLLRQGAVPLGERTVAHDGDKPVTVPANETSAEDKQEVSK